MPPSLARLLAQATESLASVSESPRFDAELLLSHALGISRSRLLGRLGDSTEVPGFDALLKRRLAHEPVAYILGEWEFFSLPVYIEPPILVPRPETEHLVEAVLDFVGNRPARVLELCTGSGCIAAAVAKNAAACQVVATDINPRAIALARRNVERHGLQDRISLYHGDLYDALSDSKPFDVVCANPPYVEDAAWDELAPDIRLYEDPGALLAGPEGLDCIARIAQGARERLRPKGLLALEVGMGQYSLVAGLLRGCGFTDVEARRDLAGIDRIVCAHAPSGATPVCE
jgi:release factor glutamine methyltransferase